MNTPTQKSIPTAWDTVAHEKLVRVLGPTEGARVFHETMAEVKLDHLTTAEDLMRFADILARRGGFVRTLGAVLRTHALLRGAVPLA